MNQWWIWNGNELSRERSTRWMDGWWLKGTPRSSLSVGSLAGTSTASIGRKTSSFRSSYWGEWCLECCNGVCTPVASAEQYEGYILEMQDVEVIAHRRSVVRLTYLAQDRRDIALIANSLAPDTSKSSRGRREWSESFGTWGLILVIAWTSSFKRCPSRR